MTKIKITLNQINKEKRTLEEEIARTSLNEEKKKREEYELARAQAIQEIPGILANAEVLKSNSSYLRALDLAERFEIKLPKTILKVIADSLAQTGIMSDNTNALNRSAKLYDSLYMKSKAGEVREAAKTIKEEQERINRRYENDPFLDDY